METIISIYSGISTGSNRFSMPQSIRFLPSTHPERGLSASPAKKITTMVSGKVLPSGRPSMLTSRQRAGHCALCPLAGKPDLSAIIRSARRIFRSAVLGQLWNPDFQHFTDHYQRSTPYVTEGNFIRGREMAGYLPGSMNFRPRKQLASGKRGLCRRLKHVLSPAEWLGRMGCALSNHRIRAIWRNTDMIAHQGNRSASGTDHPGPSRPRRR